MSKHAELPYDFHATNAVAHATEHGWTHFRLLSVDGYGPVLVKGRVNMIDTKVVRATVVVQTMPGRPMYWRTPDARWTRRFASMVAADAGATLSSDRVDPTGGSASHWTFRFDTVN